MAKKRTSMSRRLRFDVFKRDSFVCQYCGSHPPSIVLHVDHIVPVSAGGENVLENLITSCESCNLGKGARPLRLVPDRKAVDVDALREREEQAAGYAEVMLAKRRRVDEHCWIVADFYLHSARKGSISVADFRSIKTFVERIGVDETLEAMEIAAERAPNNHCMFRYFCGVAWRKVREIECPDSQ